MRPSDTAAVDDVVYANAVTGSHLSSRRPSRERTQHASVSRLPSYDPGAVLGHMCVAKECSISTEGLQEPNEMRALCCWPGFRSQGGRRDD